MSNQEQTPETRRSALVPWLILDLLCGLFPIGLAIGWWAFGDPPEGIARQLFCGLMQLSMMLLGAFSVYRGIAKCRDLFADPITVKGRVSCKSILPRNRHTAPFDGPHLRIETDQGQLEYRVSECLYNSVNKGDLVLISLWPHSRKIYSMRTIEKHV